MYLEGVLENMFRGNCYLEDNKAFGHNSMRDRDPFSLVEKNMSRDFTHDIVNMMYLSNLTISSLMLSYLLHIACLGVVVADTLKPKIFSLNMGGTKGALQFSLKNQ